MSIQKTYQSQVHALIHNLNITMISNPNVIHLLAKSQAASPSDQAKFFLTEEAFNYDLSSLTLISTNGIVLAQSFGTPDPHALLQYKSLIDRGLNGNTVTILEKIPRISNVSSSSTNAWDIDYVIPIVLKDAGGQSGILVASQRIDNNFASDLVRNSHAGLNVI